MQYVPNIIKVGFWVEKTGICLQLPSQLIISSTALLDLFMCVCFAFKSAVTLS